MMSALATQLPFAVHSSVSALIVFLSACCLCRAVVRSDPIDFVMPDGTVECAQCAIFVTCTCNPKWPEIQDALPARSHWKFHPDVVARAFMLKLKEFMHDIVINEIFGTVRAYVYRIEWQVSCLPQGFYQQLTFIQARGLPHCHALIIL